MTRKKSLIDRKVAAHTETKSDKNYAPIHTKI